MSPLRWQIGRVRVTRIAECVVPFDREFLCPGSDPATFARHRAWLEPDYVTADGRILLSIHALLVESAGRRILVDTCLGEGFDLGVFPDAGDSFLRSLAEADFEPADIDVVLCTHLHYDHIGWNTRLEAGRRVPTFPNARYLFARREWDHWREADDAGVPTTLDACVEPILAAGLADLVETDHRITPEVVLEPTPGHTPGHVSVRISSEGHEAFITGDAVVHPVQWAEVEWGNPEVDHDLARAIAVRRALRARHAGREVLVIGTHFAPPTAGHVREGRGGWWFEGLGRGAPGGSESG